MTIVLAMTLSAQPAGFPNDLSHWYVSTPPAEGTDRWYVANADVDHEWVVALDGRSPLVHLLRNQKESRSPLPFEIEPGSAVDGLAGKRSIAKTEDGWIVSFNAGEFGAGLWWFSPDGRRRLRISGDHVIDLVPTTAGLFAVEGIAHGGVSRGRILRLSRSGKGQWLTEPIVDLGHAPQVVTKDVDGSLVVATTQRLIRVIPASKQLDVLLGKAFWGGLYPNSMVISPTGTIYIGMRHGIAKVEKKGASYRVDWLLPNRRFDSQPYNEEFK